ncbi:hypothetical protein [Streptomyces longispororuber]|uniref:hypothetical protein n=1 Tax=Streptomyces longispororuber TaxID=68230 RepID=UPI00210B073A|nr:hypothetical protein [Streptomyces longispororuber]MCQ4212588.1 hypothetical protein [Streptomyces longispororuber]
MTDWSKLEHAYGTAEDVPALFERLGTERNDEVWKDLWSRLCHQGSVYSASFAALALLADLGRGADTHADNALILAGAITTDADDETRGQYGAPIERLQTLAHDRIRRPAEPALYVYLLQTAMALNGVPVWSVALESLADGMIEVFCPECEMGVCVSIGEAGYFSAVGDWEPGDPEGSPLRAAEPDDMSGPARVLYDAASEAGVDTVVLALTYLFGEGTCGECGTEFSVAGQVAEQY